MWWTQTANQSLPNILIDNINNYHSLSANRNIHCLQQVVMVTVIIE